MANEEKVIITGRETLDKADMESMVAFIKSRKDATELHKAEFALALVESTTKARAYIKTHFFPAKTRADKVKDALDELGMTKEKAEEIVEKAKETAQETKE